MADLTLAIDDALNHGAQLGSLRLINPLRSPPRPMEP